MTTKEWLAWGLGFTAIGLVVAGTWLKADLATALIAGGGAISGVASLLGYQAKTAGPTTSTTK